MDNKLEQQGQRHGGSGKVSDIQEILLVPMGETIRDLYLLMRTAPGDLHIYKAFSHILDEDANAEKLSIRFSRVPNRHITRPPLSFLQGGETLASVLTTPVVLEDRTVAVRRRTIVDFDRISVHSGAFVAGIKPMWLLAGSKRALRMHPMRCDGHVKAFSPFHVAGCHYGFLYFNEQVWHALLRFRSPSLIFLQDLLRFCHLPDHMMYDATWPYRKIFLKRTPHHIGFIESSNTYAVVTSKSIPFTLRSDSSVEDFTQQGYTLPQTEDFHLELFSTETWTSIDAFHFEDDEYVMSMKSIILDSKSTTTGKKTFIGLGTTTVKGEDNPANGHVSQRSLVICLF